MHLDDTMKTASHISCVLADVPLMSTKFLQVLYSSLKHVSLPRRIKVWWYLRKEISWSLHKDWGTWWPKCGIELEPAATSDSCRKLFQLIWSTRNWQPGMSRTIFEVDGAPLANIQSRLGQWAVFKWHFSWPVTPAMSVNLTRDD